MRIHKKFLLWLQAALCLLLAALLIAAALDICLDGSARRRVDPGAAVYTAETIDAHAKAPLAVLAAVAVTAILCAALGVRAAQAGQPVRTAAMVPGRPAAGNRRQRMLRGVLFLLAAGCIVIGICNGSMKDVLVKAVNLCTECIGLG